MAEYSSEALAYLCQCRAESGAVLCIVTFEEFVPFAS